EMSRSQTSLFPVSLEELIPEDHLVRVIDLYVAIDGLQCVFTQSVSAFFFVLQPKSPGQPGLNGRRRD
ncbi:hypothetical protein SB772_40215, partial [Paraburkholderia sp. SIMBA_030]